MGGPETEGERTATIVIEVERICVGNRCIALDNASRHMICKDNVTVCYLFSVEQWPAVAFWRKPRPVYGKKVSKFFTAVL
jgi:hypothetical protein